MGVPTVQSWVFITGIEKSPTFGVEDFVWIFMIWFRLALHLVQL